MLSCALVLTLFLFQKGQGFFPPLPIAALLPAVGAGQTQMALLGMLRCGWVISRRKRPLWFPNHAGLYRPTDREPHQTGEPRGLSPSGGNSAAKPLSLEWPCAPTARSPGLRGTAPYWLRGWRAMVSSMICLRSSSLMPARISLMESIRGLPLAKPTAMDVSPSATVKPSPSSKDR